ncbi:uncharacterized protein LOC135223042, partial [Macrobrachium nipponense]|uniref:uncharacterized protein LOC135223042 n=1 Tax=Macrobrachium nipponense TaxID=159736 RepID=UPI0030C8CFC1
AHCYHCFLVQVPLRHNFKFLYYRSLSPPILQSPRAAAPYSPHPRPVPPTPSKPSLHQATTPKQVPSLESLLELKAPPPPDGIFTASPKFEDSPLRALGTSRAPDRKQKALFITEARFLETPGEQESGQVSEELTPRPFVASPTTIRFTLDDVPDFLEPSVFPTIGHTDFSSSASDESGTVLENPFTKEEVNEETPALGTNNPDTKTHLFILTSTEDAQETTTWTPSTLFASTPDFSEKEQLTSTPFSFSSIPDSDTSFRPSFVFPFLDHSSEQQNLFAAVETRNPSVSSFLRSEAPNFLESSPEIFELNPVRVETEVTKKEPATGILPVGNDRTLSKTPVPKPIIFSDQEKAGETITESVTKPDKPLPTRKTFHFEQEFLSLLKKNNPREKSRPEKNEPSFESNPFWFTEQRDVNEGVWRLKGGERAPTLDLVSQDSIVSPITLKNTLGGLFSASIRGLTPTKQKSEASLKILDDREEPVTDVGITVKSLAQGGLSSSAFETKGITTTIKPLILNQNFSETRLKLGASTPAGLTSHGPKIVPVGEVGEVPHDTDGATAIPLPSLSATLKHGVQSLNVTAWVSGCPKLYGKAELICVIEHDAISNTAMAVREHRRSIWCPKIPLSPRSHLKTHWAGLFSASIRGLTPTKQKSEASLKILDDREPELTSHGPKIVPVGEVGEVPHDTDGATAIPLPSLSATLKHGVQSLNVTAWVSGCPKLYGKAELICVIEHDAISNTAMTVMWKKKSFTEGRPQEHIMAENDLLMMEDERFSLRQNEGRYTLTIKDFRPKDCGTYECEAKAADTTAASQLLLFTCH